MGYRDIVRHQQMTGRIAREMEKKEREMEKRERKAAAEPGDRVRLLGTDDIFTQLRPGDEGTVRFVDDLGTVHVDWDNGSGLGLVPFHDKFQVIR